MGRGRPAARDRLEPAAARYEEAGHLDEPAGERGRRLLIALATFRRSNPLTRSGGGIVFGLFEFDLRGFAGSGLRHLDLDLVRIELAAGIERGEHHRRKGDDQRDMKKSDTSTNP